MLNFDEEVRKFKPSLEVEKIKSKEDTDLIDLIKEMIKNKSKE